MFIFSLAFRAANLQKGWRRRFAKDVRCSTHETGMMGYVLGIGILPPVWIICRKTVDDETRFVTLVRELTHPHPLFLTLNYLLTGD